jgi:hypothetical protein
MFPSQTRTQSAKGIKTTIIQQKLRNGANWQAELKQMV